VPRVLLPAPALIVDSMVVHAPKLWADFVQTVGKGVLVGWVLGCALGFGVALAIDRLPFLQRGFVAGGLSDQRGAAGGGGADCGDVVWLSSGRPKPAVVVLMTFFPMLVSTLAGLKPRASLSAS